MFNKNDVKVIIKKIVGIALIVGGLFGLFLPFFQGIAMIIAGAFLLESKYIIKQVKRLIAYLKRHS